MREVPGYFAAECKHCKELLQVKLPLGARTLVNIALAFEKSHKDCANTQKWIWMMDWCKQMGLSPSSYGWKKAEEAWNKQFKSNES
jgi:hypothetical protein